MNKVGIAFLGGILMGLTPAPFEIWPLAWIALAPLWILIKRARTDKNNLLFPCLAGMAWGCGYHGLALFWITGVHPMTWMGVPWLASLAIAIFCLVAIALWGAVLVAVWSVGMSWVERLKVEAPIKILCGVALWCALEALWNKGPLWWSSLAYTQSPHNLAILQLSQLSGPSTITAAIVAVNGLFAEALTIEGRILKFKKRFLIANIALLFGLHSLGFWMFARPIERREASAIKVGIIQGNIPNEIKLYESGEEQALQKYTLGYETLADRGNVDIVLTPEGALPFFWNYLVESNSNFYRTILEKKVPIWVGAFGKQSNGYTNSLFTVTGEGQTYSRYDKTILVPLGEYIPFEEVLGKIVDRLSPLDAHLIAGKREQLIDTPLGRAIVGICYESAFAEHFRRQTAKGGEFIITVSNDAHYSSSMPAQHHALDLMRAIESDRWMARATNTGLSAFVDPRGRTVWISNLKDYQLHADTIYRQQTRTLYVRAGDWLTTILSILTVGTLVTSYKKFG